MANPTPPPPALAPYVGDYYAAHDKCLYRVGYAHGSLTLCRSCTCRPDPAQDQFSTAYPIEADQLTRLLGFGSFTSAS